MPNVGTFLGLSAVAAGIWFVDSAVQNRAPISVLKDVVKSPSTAVSTVAKAKGTAYPVPSSGGSASAAGFNTSGGGGTVAGNGAVAFARAQIGKPYKWGATGPSSFDCSGLVQQAYKSVGISLPRTTAGMVLIGSPVSKKNLQIGDLVFPDPGHVQLYSGNGNVVEAPRTGEKVREVKMWGFFTARRIPTSTGTVSV